jgi:hypothetical protein
MTITGGGPLRRSNILESHPEERSVKEVNMTNANTNTGHLDPLATFSRRCAISTARTTTIRHLVAASRCGGGPGPPLCGGSPDV